jgi:transcriptional regulator with XRE-family HTH domain
MRTHLQVANGKESSPKLLGKTGPRWAYIVLSMEPTAALAARLKATRRKLQLTQAQAARRSGFVLTTNWARNLPTFAQQTNKPDPQLRQKLVDAIKKHTDALDKNDATAVAANFTENGILVTLNGPIFGREAIEKHYAEDFKQGFRSSKNTATPMTIHLTS